MMKKVNINTIQTKSNNNIMKKSTIQKMDSLKKRSIILYEIMVERINSLQKLYVWKFGICPIIVPFLCNNFAGNCTTVCDAGILTTLCDAEIWTTLCDAGIWTTLCDERMWTTVFVAGISLSSFL